MCNTIIRIKTEDSLMEIIKERLKRAFNLTFDLANSLNDDQLSLYLGDLPSNKIGDQLWCVIGARESYLRAIKRGQWAGFSCSLQNNTVKVEVIKALSESKSKIIEFLDKIELTDRQLAFAIDLLEHEIQHHGQLIRYMYGNRIQFPKSWNDRYTV